MVKNGQTGDIAAHVRSATFLFFCALLYSGPIAGVPLGSSQATPESGSEHLLRADEAYSRENWKVAASEYQQALRADPGNAEALAHLGIAEQRLGLAKEAEGSFERALQLRPSLPEVDVLLGLVRIQEGKYREALTPLEGAFAKPDYDVAVRAAAGERLVEIYFTLAQPEKAFEMVQKLRQLAPNDPDVLYTASKVYAAMWNEAVQRLLVKAPDSYRIHQVLAEVAEAQQNYAEAAKEYQLIVRMAPELPDFHYRLGRAILESDATAAATQRAMQAFQEELKLNPRDVRSLAQIGEVYLKSHQIEEAARCLSHAVELDPGYSEARIGLAKVRLEEKQFSEAADQLEKAARLSPDDETIYYNLMFAYRGLGRQEEARHALEQFQKLSKQKQEEHASIMRQLKGAMGGTEATNR